MGPIGVQEMLGIVIVALLLFGPKKLPELGRMVGKGLREFRRIRNEMKSTFETHLQELEREVRLSETPDYRRIPDSNSYSNSNSYTYPYEQPVPTYDEAVAKENESARAAMLEAHVEPVAPSESAVSPAPESSAVPGTVARNG